MTWAQALVALVSVAQIVNGAALLAMLRKVN